MFLFVHGFHERYDLTEDLSGIETFQLGRHRLELTWRRLRDGDWIHYLGRFALDGKPTSMSPEFAYRSRSHTGELEYRFREFVIHDELRLSELVDAVRGDGPAKIVQPFKPAKKDRNKHVLIVEEQLPARDEDPEMFTRVLVECDVEHRSINVETEFVWTYPAANAPEPISETWFAPEQYDPGMRESGWGQDLGRTGEEPEAEGTSELALPDGTPLRCTWKRFAAQPFKYHPRFLCRFELDDDPCQTTEQLVDTSETNSARRTRRLRDLVPREHAGSWHVPMAKDVDWRRVSSRVFQTDLEKTLDFTAYDDDEARFHERVTVDTARRLVTLDRTHRRA